jgi:fused signal recognition particle receptor
VTQTLWIVIVVVAVLIVLAVVLGLVLRRSRRINLREAEKRAELPPRAGTYKAEGGFSFSAGTETAPPKPTDSRSREQIRDSRPAGGTAPDTDAPAPVAERPASGAAPVAERPLADTPPTAPVAERPTSGAAPVAERPLADTPPTAPVAERPAADTPPTAPVAERPATAAPSTAPVEGRATPVVPPAAPVEGRPATAAPPVAERPPTAAPPAPAGPAGNGVATPAAPADDIAPAEGRLERLRGRLARSRSGFGQGLLGLLGAGELDEESWEDVETMFLQADLGPEMTVELVEILRSELARRGVRTPEQARALLRDVLTDALRTDLDRSVRALPHDGRPAVLLIVGVNGTGKTTTTGKLARVLVASGRHVVLGAADTFRAAAAEQLATWGERAGATVVRGPEGADPASVAFDAVKQGDEEGADAVLVDTAGRLHTKTGLMDELGKVKRVVSRQALVDEVLLVIDATTGQNGLTQARVFGDVVDVTGIVLTKLDGTAKGGIVFRVQRELGVPVKLVGLGEGPDDLAPFEPAAFVDALLE